MSTENEKDRMYDASTPANLVEDSACLTRAFALAQSIEIRKTARAHQAAEALTDLDRAILKQYPFDSETPAARVLSIGFNLVCNAYAEEAYQKNDSAAYAATGTTPALTIYNQFKL